MRLTTLSVKPDRIAELTAQMARLSHKLQTVRGLLGGHVAWRGDGRCVITAVYRSKAAALAATAQVLSIMAEMQEFVDGPPHVETFDNVQGLLD